MTGDYKSAKMRAYLSLFLSPVVAASLGAACTGQTALEIFLHPMEVDKNANF